MWFIHIIQMVHLKGAAVVTAAAAATFAALGAGTLEISVATIGALGTWVAAALNSRSKKQTAYQAARDAELKYLRQEIKEMRASHRKELHDLRAANNKLEAEYDDLRVKATNVKVAATHVVAQLRAHQLAPVMEIPDL